VKRSTGPLLFVLFFCGLLGAAARGENAAPRVRPAAWAAPVINTSLANCYRVSEDLFRCEQPALNDLGDLQALGIRGVLNLRAYHTDSHEFARNGLMLLAEPMNAGEVTAAQLAAALRKFRAAPKPLLVHCWHGSDRTGVFVAAYRLVFQEWTREAALDEFRHGGFGFHEKWYPNLLQLLQSLDIEALRQEVER
jgi:tyrosine-protein phosphatase SIW14